MLLCYLKASKGFRLLLETNKSQAIRILRPEYGPALISGAIFSRKRSQNSHGEKKTQKNLTTILACFNCCINANERCRQMDRSEVPHDRDKPVSRSLQALVKETPELGRLLCSAPGTRL